MIKICGNKNIVTAKGIWTVVCSLLTRPDYLVFVREIFVFLKQSIPTETKNEWLLWPLGQNELSVVVNVKSFALNSIQSSGILIKERLSWFQRFFCGRHVLSHPEKNWNNKAEEQIGRVCLSFVSYISGVEYIKVFQKEKTKISYVKVNM